MNLEQYIKKIYSKGLSYDEMNQLCLHLFSTVEYLPIELQSECRKEGLTKIFSNLSSIKFMLGSITTSAVFMMQIIMKLQLRGIGSRLLHQF